jgi:hypothetical protein
MKKVNIPYQMQANKMIVPPVAWPKICPCCGSQQADATYSYSYRARQISTTTGAGSTSTYYDLKFEYPICKQCNSHAQTIANLPAFFFLGGLLLIIALGVALSDDLLPMLAYMAGTVVLALILYQLILRLVVLPKKKPTCANTGYPIYASDDESNIVFHFYRDDYAALFANFNQSPLMDDTPPKKAFALFHS